MSERIDIANSSLAYLGVDPVSSLEDPTKEARILKLRYEMVRDATLEAVDWSFARKRFIPAELSEAPLYGWDHAFAIPSDILAVRRVERNYSNDRKNKLHFGDPNPIPHVVENRKILTDETGIHCLGTRRVEDEGIYSPLFTEALALRLAMAVCLPLTQSRSRLSDVTALYSGTIAQASSVDGQQSTGRRFRNDRMQRVR